MISFNKFSQLLLCVGVGCVTVLGSSYTSATATADFSNCSQTGAATAGCNVSAAAGPNGPATASGQAISLLDVGGRLEATSDGFGPNTTASALARYSGTLIVNGVTGSGELSFRFTGFQDLTNATSGTGVFPLSLTVGGNSTTSILPAGGPSVFFASVPVDFGVLLPFSFSISDKAAGSMFHDGTFEREDADAVITAFPTFVVTDDDGKRLRGATVGIVPEPATFALLLCAVPVALIGRRRTRRARA